MGWQVKLVAIPRQLRLEYPGAIYHMSKMNLSWNKITRTDPFIFSETTNNFMKTIKILIGSLLVVVFGVALKAQTNQERFEALYNEWHQTVDAGAEPNYFRTDLGRAGEINREIESNKVAMAYFLCEKMANTQYSKACL